MSANPIARRPNQCVTCRQSYDHESVWCVRLNAHMQMSAAATCWRQMLMWCVCEVRKQHPACIVTLEGRPQRRRERVDGADARVCVVPSRSRSSEGLRNEINEWLGCGRRPESIAAEFGLRSPSDTPFHTTPSCSQYLDHFSHSLTHLLGF